MSYLNLKKNDFQNIINLFYYTANSDSNICKNELKLLDAITQLYNRVHNTNLKYQLIQDFEGITTSLKHIKEEDKGDLLSSLVLFSKLDNNVCEIEKSIITATSNTIEYSLDDIPEINTLNKLIYSNILFNNYMADDILSDEEESKLETLCKENNLPSFMTLLNAEETKIFTNLLTEDQKIKTKDLI